MDGGDYQGYRQGSKNTQAVLITSTMSGSVTTGYWFGFEVVSSVAAIALVEASGITGSSLITSGTSYPLNTWIGGGLTTGIRLSADSTGHKVLAYEQTLL